MHVCVYIYIYTHMCACVCVYISRALSHTHGPCATPHRTRHHHIPQHPRSQNAHRRSADATPNRALAHTQTMQTRAWSQTPQIDRRGMRQRRRQHGAASRGPTHALAWRRLTPSGDQIAPAAIAFYMASWRSIQWVRPRGARLQRIHTRVDVCVCCVGVVLTCVQDSCWRHRPSRRPLQ